MSDVHRISAFLKPKPRFARSVHLERDFADSAALDQYIVTDKVNQLFRRFGTAFKDGSTERAWRITGDYGTGKSCFALALARLCSTNGGDGVPRPLKRLAKPLSHVHALPVLVTGSREPISTAIVRALKKALTETGSSRKKPSSLSRIDRTLRESSASDRDRFAIDLLCEATQFVNQTRHGSGILLILDELGKALEFATQNPDQQDITFLQTLAETASRSGDTPFVVLGILHQGFTAYADRMEATDQREWDKIGGRFEELLFDQPLEQLLALVSSALGVKVGRLPKSVLNAAKNDMSSAIDLGWFGAVSSRSSLIEQAAAIYPLQPILLPVLVKFFSRFGQNERSLFSFLNSTDPEALRAFAANHSVGDGFYGIHHLYNFARSSIGYRLNTRELSSRWNQIDSVIDALSASSSKEIAVLKTVGILNMLDDQTLLPTDEALQFAIANTCLPNRPSTAAVASGLRSKKRVLYKRGTSGGYCLWPHTSVNLELRYKEAEMAVRQVQNVIEAVSNNLEERPIVARRHYIKTGTLRHFDVAYVTASKFMSAVQNRSSTSCDGVVLVPLCTTTAERNSVLESIAKLKLRNHPEVMIAVPEPVSGFGGLVTELRRWEWLRNNTSELSGDKYAREEVSRRIEATRAVLRTRTNHALDVRSFRDGQGLAWIHKGKPIELDSARDLFAYISKICDRVFTDTPTLRNELLNRRKLSSAAAAARMRLIERVLDNATEPLLGMDPEKKPPEMSMYLSALQNSHLHSKNRHGWRIQLPKKEYDNCNLLPLFDRLRASLEEEAGKRILVSDLFAELRKPPVGARDGILPLMFAVFCVAESQHLAMYEDGSFVQEIAGAEFARLSKAPETFELQYCKLSGVRSEVFHKLLRVVDSHVDDSRSADLLDLVKPLCQFAASLPDYTRNTTNLSTKTLAVRDTLLNATEPAVLLFEDLPKACGLPPVPSRQQANQDQVMSYVRSLKRAMGELRSTYPNLLSRIESMLGDAFDAKLSGAKLRTHLEKQGEHLSLHVVEPTLKAFCLRMSDANLPRDTWLESIGSLVVAKPPRRWTDRDEPEFSQAIQELVERFRKTASMLFARGDSRDVQSVRISFLQMNGVEKSRVLSLDTADVAAAKRIEKQLEKAFQSDPDIALAVASRLLLKRFSGNDETQLDAEAHSEPLTK